VRATLHDELMREAGFESDYERDLAERRERRLQTRRRDVLRATRVAGFLGAIALGVAWIIETDGKSGRIPWAVWLVVIVLITIGGLAQLVQRRMTRGETKRHHLRRMWRAITRPWRDAAR
jgi:hypothetical protein